MRNAVLILACVLLVVCAVNAQRRRSLDKPILANSESGQKSKLPKNEPQPSPTPSLDQRLAELSKDISDEITGNQKTTVAVADFVDLDGRVTSFGKFLAEELITRLYKTKKLKVIERQRLDKVIAEQKLSLTDIIDASSAKRIGRILGVDAIVAGSTSELGDTFRINARIISTETGELLAAAAVTVAKDKEVCSLVSCGTKLQSSSNPANATLRPTAPQSGSRVAVRDFVFEGESCRRTSGSLLCQLTVSNESNEDRPVNVFGSSYFGGRRSQVFDEFGNQYLADETSFGSSTLKDCTERGGCYPSMDLTMIARVPTRVRLTFDGISPQARTVRLLRVTFTWEDPRRGRITINGDLKNIPILN
jgi:TolB-like protein